MVALKPKMYVVKPENKEVMNPSTDKKTAKGVSMAIKIHVLRFEDYLTTLFSNSKRTDAMTRFQSFDHKIFTVVTNKTSLSAYDDKRYYLSDGIHSLSYGHHLIDGENPKDHSFQDPSDESSVDVELNL